MKYEKLQTSSDENFRRITGVKKETFQVMLEILKKAHQLKKVKGGRPNKLSIEEMLLMCLEYLREYRTYLTIANSYGVSESNTFKIIRWVEDTLIQSGTFDLPGKDTLLMDNIDYEIVLIDATECPIQRPQKQQNDFYSGKKKRHVLKAQLVIDKATGIIICTSYTNGKQHDFQLFKYSNVCFKKTTKIITDSGYLGLDKIHSNSAMPKKKQESSIDSK